jgi:DegV family protein with EDD domain
VPVAVVTDSSAYLPDGFAARHAVHVVPLHVLIEDRSGLDGVDIGPNEVASALAGKRTVTTSRPNPDEFADVYRKLLDGGADGVVSVHLSRQLSGTWESARLAAQEFGVDQVRVVDSRTTVMGLGFAVLRAATAAIGGASGEVVEDAAVEAAERTTTFFVVETLEYLRRGGRIGSAAAFLGTALAVKPLLHVVDGRIVPLEKVRTTHRAVLRLVDLAEQAASATGAAPVELAVHERAAELVTLLDERISPVSGCVVSELGAAIGAHTGPGMLGVVVCPAER